MFLKLRRHAFQVTKNSVYFCVEYIFRKTLCSECVKAIGGSGVIFASEAYCTVHNPAE